jgi:hypothetical protein
VIEYDRGFNVFLYYSIVIGNESNRIFGYCFWMMWLCKGICVLNEVYWVWLRCLEVVWLAWIVLTLLRSFDWHYGHAFAVWFPKM